MLAKHLNNARYHELRLLWLCFGCFSALGGSCLCACQLKKMTIQPLLIKTTPEKAYLFSKCLLIGLVSNNKRSIVLVLPNGNYFC